MVAKIRQQAGDTIVEVLIAMVVISTVLAGAFVVSRTSLTNVRNSEEHSQALKRLQGQMEQIRANVDSLPASDFCFDSAGAITSAPCDFDSIHYKITIRDISASRGGPAGTATYEGTVKWTAINGRDAQEQLVYSIAK